MKRAGLPLAAEAPHMRGCGGMMGGGERSRDDEETQKKSKPADSEKRNGG